MMPFHRRGHRRSPNQPLRDYLNDQNGPYLPQRLTTSSSRLPAHALQHDNRSYCGVSPQSNRTSRLVDTGSDDAHGSLPELESSLESLALSSAHTSMAERQGLEHNRTLDLGPENVLLAVPSLPTPLQCPFRILGCPLDYSNFQHWLWHSIGHFKTGPSRLASESATVMPPQENRCCFCPKKFFSISGMRSWVERMHHVAEHHRIGHTLSHARTDFQLLDHLWANYLIDEETYREIKGNTPDRSQMTNGNPSPPTSDTSGSPPGTPTTAEARPVCVMNERRRDRRRIQPH
ncbi:hypothetical protein ACLMJK_005416 [Lecanora helva]